MSAQYCIQPYIFLTHFSFSFTHSHRAFTTGICGLHLTICTSSGRFVVAPKSRFVFSLSLCLSHTNSDIPQQQHADKNNNNVDGMGRNQQTLKKTVGSKCKCSWPPLDKNATKHTQKSEKKNGHTVTVQIITSPSGGLVGTIRIPRTPFPPRHPLRFLLHRNRTGRSSCKTW